ncbi:MAG: hypothetical protein IAG10_04410 [Planctomycetaceae bacterium]|nr:hypothetical protein [Planctomycetaceae bacterium]
MSDRLTLGINCDDVLKDNGHWYALKARRKKIALVRIEVTNPLSADVQVVLGSTKLTAAGKTFDIESPAVILRKLSEFTWDFLLYALLDFHPVMAVLDVSLLLTGPLYNRRLRRQLANLTDADLSLRPGESKTAIVAFRGVPKGWERVTIVFRSCQTEVEQQVAFPSA